MKAVNYTIVILILSSCTSSKLYNLQINDIPGKDHDRPIMTFHMGEEPELPPFIEITELSAKGQGAISKDKAANIIINAARKAGMDAVIDIYYEGWSEEYISFLDLVLEMVDGEEEYYSIRDVYTIHGIGVKFLANMDYIESLPEFENIFLVENGAFTPFLNLEMKPTGEVFQLYFHHDESNKFYREFLSGYSDFHLLDEKLDWKYKYLDEQKLKRILYNGNKIIRTVKIWNNSAGKPKELVVKNFYGSSILKAKVFYHYNSDGEISQKKIIYSNKNELIINYSYENGKLKSCKYDLYSDSQLALSLQSAFKFYSKEYIDGFYRYLSTSSLEDQ